VAVPSRRSKWDYDRRRRIPPDCSQATNHTIGRTLQLPQSPARAHYVKANVKVREYPDGTLAVLHGPRRLARYSAQGHEIVEAPTTPSVTPCSPPSRRGLARAEIVDSAARRPSLTAAARGVTGPGQVGTKKRPSGRTKKLTRKKEAYAASVSV
jgi:hypothetical protein